MARTLSSTISKAARAESTRTRAHPICTPRISGGSMNPNRANRPSSASGTKALTPATEARPTPNPVKRRTSTASIITRPGMDRPRSNPPVTLGYTCLILRVRRTRARDPDDGQDSGLLQAEGLRVPELGDLRRPPFLLRLRSPRRRDEAKHQGGVVAPHGLHARGHGRPRLGDNHASQGMGGVGA